MMAASPCVRVALPKRASSKVMPLGAVDVEGLTAAVPERYRPPIVLAAGMGLRQAECFGLTVDRVEFLRRAARVDRQLVAVRGGVPEIGPPKTTAGPAPYRCSKSYGPCWPLTLPATVLVLAGWSSLIASATRRGAARLTKCGTERGRRRGCPAGRPSTICDTSMPPCSSPRAARLKPSRAGSVTNQPWKRWTLTGTSGRTATRPGWPSTTSWGLWL